MRIDLFQNPLSKATERLVRCSDPHVPCVHSGPALRSALHLSLKGGFERGLIKIIPNDHSISRLIFYPYSYLNSKIDPLHTFQFSRKILEDGSITREESVNWNEEISSQEIHDMGHNKAKEDSEKKKKEILYKGYRVAGVKGVRDINLNEIYFIIEHKPEKGNFAHCKIDILNIDNKTPTQIREAKTELFEKFSLFNTT